MCGNAQIKSIGKDKADETKKAINMVPQDPIKVQEGKCWDFFVDLPEFDRTKVNKNLVKRAMLLEPLFEFSGSCEQNSHHFVIIGETLPPLYRQHYNGLTNLKLSSSKLSADP